MKHKEQIKIVILSLLVVSIVLCGTVSALTVTDCTVTNTNIYAPSNQNDISPSGTYSSSTATGITHVANRYVYATAVTASPNPAAINEEVTYTIVGQQGAAVYDDTDRAISGYGYAYGDGDYDHINTHTYTTTGTYSIEAELMNPSELGVTVYGSVVVNAPGPQITAVTLTSSSPAPLTSPITATVTANSPGGAALSYQWYYNTDSGSTWNIITGQTTASLSYTPQTAGTYYLKAVVTDSSGSTDSYEAGFTDVIAQVVTAPTLGTATINMEHGALNTPYEIKISFPLNDLGGASAVYTRLQYSTDGVTWGNTDATMRDTTGTYSFTQTVNDNTATTHYYRVTAAAIDDVASVTATSNTVTFQSYAAPVISGITAPDKVQVGTAFTFSASATDANTVTYQLSSNSGTTWTDITSPYTIQTAGTYQFRVTATGYGGTTTSTPQNIAAYVLPAITSTPTATPAQGPLTQTVSLAIDTSGITGSDLTYQWQEQISGTWTDISGATSTTRSQPVSDTAGKTHTYRLKVSNIGGSAESQSVTYQSYAAPTISTITAPDKVQVGTPFTVSASATDAQTITYQLSSNSGTTWTDITSPYTIQTAGTYQFRVTATGYGGTTTSTPQNIAAYVLPAITSTPTATPAQGPLSQTVTLSIDTSGITGSAPLSYQWQEQISGVWTDISGATSTTRSQPVSDTAGKTHTYRLVVSNIGGSAESAAVTYQSYAAPQFTAVNVPSTINIPDSLVFSATAIDANTITYHISTDQQAWTEITSPHTIQTAGTYYFYALAVGYGGETQSQIKTIVASDQIPVFSSATASPTSGVIPFSVTFSAAATHEPSYTWYETTTGTNVQIGTGASLQYTLSADKYGDGTYTFICVAENPYGTATSNVISVKGIVPPVITTTPTASPTQGPLSQTVTLSIDTSGITGSAPLSYQWQEQISDVWTDISGATSTTRSQTVSDTAGKTHTYRLVVSNIGGSAESAAVTYQSYAAPQFTAVNVPTYLLAPGTITFSATATDATSIIYQISTNQAAWTAITSPYSITTPGTYYFRAYASGYGGSTYSQTVTITASDGTPAFTSVSANPTSGILPFEVTFSATATNNPTYTWYETTSGTRVQIGTGERYLWSIPSSRTAGTYSFICVATNSFGSTTSNQITITAYAQPTATVTPEVSSKVTVNDRFILQTTSGGTSYQWQYKPANSVQWRNINGATTSQFIFTPKEVGIGSGTYQFRAQMIIYGHEFTAETTTIIIYTIQPRQMATVPIVPVPTDSLNGITDAFDVEPGQYPDFKEAVKAVVEPIEGDLPDGFLFVIVFGVIFLMLWLITKNTAVPSIIGLIFGGTILAFFPASYYGPAIAILAISITGGIYRVFQPPK